jgi:hypothetical protein
VSPSPSHSAPRGNAVAPPSARRAAAWRRLLPSLLLAGALLVAALTPVAVAAVAPQPGQRIDLKVLLLSADGKEPTFGAWKAALAREGVPYEAKIADSEGPFTDATFADYSANHAKYQAVILSTGDLVHQVTNPDGTVSFPSSLADSEWTALAKFQLSFGIRQLSDATFPSPVHGLNAPTNTGEQGGNTGQLTAAGLELFPYLNGQVPIDNPSAAVDAFGHQATPAAQTAPASFQTLLSGPNGSSYLGIYTHADGREEMVMTVDSNENQMQSQLLRHGMLGWVTRGAYLGYQRNYLEMQVDDIFLPDARWDTTLNRTLVDGVTTAPDETQCAPEAGGFISGGGVAPTPNPVPGTPGTTLPPCRAIRMTAADVTRLLTWQNANGIKLDMVFNGGGSAEFKQDTGSTTDPMADALLANKGQFHWINHTFTHLNLDLLPGTGADSLTSQIGDNISYGRANALPFDPEELVTGEHSGLHNAAMPGVLGALGVKWVAADNSREPTPYAIGSALTVPRYPTNVYYNVETQAEQLDEYNYIYMPPPAGRCVASAVNTCRTAPATWAQYIGSEADIMFRHLMGNDPRPHYAHQSNLAADGVLYSLLDEVLRRYRLYFSPGLVQLTHKQIGMELQRQAKWAQDLAAGRVTAYLQDGQVHVSSTATLEVPITGTPDGSLYGGQRSGWFTVSPGRPLVQSAPSSAAAVRRAAAARPNSAVARARAQRTALRMRRLRMSPRRFAVSHSRATARRRRGRAPDGTTITWLMNDRARVTLTVQRVRSGKRVAGACVAPSRRTSRRPSCRRTVAVATLRRSAIRGENTVRFSGRIGRRVLRPGRYRMVIRARAADGRRTAARTLRFTVVRG